MIIADLNQMQGCTFPARRLTRNLVGGASPIQATNFSLGLVVLEPNGGQVPWHNQEQKETYFIAEGEGEICLGEERGSIKKGQAVYIPSGVFHQLTNTGSEPMTMIYCYGPAGDVAHWRQELDGTLPRAGIDVPNLPDGAAPQCTATDSQNQEGEPTLEQWRELGSAEANLWTITPPGGKPMSLSEHHAMKEAEEVAYQASVQRMREAHDEHAALRAKQESKGIIG